MSFSIKRLGVALLAALLWYAPLYAADVGSVRGVVHDQQHHPLARARVMLKAATSQWSQSAVTDARGEFSFMTVPLGDYVLSVSDTDFTPTAQAVSVASGSSPIAHVQLAKGSELDTLTVTASPETTVLTTATPTTVVNRLDIERAPGASVAAGITWSVVARSTPCRHAVFRHRRPAARDRAGRIAIARVRAR